MRVLVTGGLGMIGAWVVRELLDQGHEPIALDLRDDVGPTLAGVGTDFERRCGDVFDVDRLTALLTGVDAVAHLAVLLPAESDPYAGYRTNALGPVTVFEAARRAGVPRVVWASAKAVYGELSGAYGHPGYAPVPETHSRGVLPFSPVYCASKQLAEEAGRYFTATFDMAITALRFSTIFGPGKEAPRGAGLVGAIIRSGAGGEPVQVSHGGDQRDEILYVRDAARGVVATLLAGRPRSWVFNIASGILVSLPELASATRTALGTVSATIGPGLDPFGVGLMYGRLDDGRARRQLGYEPAWGLEAAIADFTATTGGG
jgi:UDP-glucose 4-epimerase